MQELIDVYDHNRNFTGLTVAREGAHMEDGQYMLYVLAIIQNRQGNILITQRSKDKSWAAGWWEVTGGGVSAGETPDEAIRRELAEEVGLDVSEYPLEIIHSYENTEPGGGDNYIVDIYHFILDISEADITLQASEAVDCRLTTIEDIDALAQQGIFLHYNRIKQALSKIK